MKKRTKALQFDKKVKERIDERDQCCMFCRIWYRMPDKPQYDNTILEHMHIVPRSKGGLGIEENGVLGCHYHHHMLDNGNLGNRDEMLQIIENRMTALYPGWDKSKLVYDKWQTFNKLQ